MTQLNRKDTVAYLKFCLEDILGANGVNTLGTYELVSGLDVIDTAPSIAINYQLLSNSQNVTTTSAKNVARRMTPESGIECIIQSDPDFVPRFMAFTGRQMMKYYEIALDQYNPTQGLIESVEAIIGDSRLYISEEPIFRPAIMDPNNGGVLPARALLYHQQTHYIQGKTYYTVV